jgi:hypothetical protein
LVSVHDVNPLTAEKQEEAPHQSQVNSRPAIHDKTRNPVTLDFRFQGATRIEGADHAPKPSLIQAGSQRERIHLHASGNERPGNLHDDAPRRIMNLSSRGVSLPHRDSLRRYRIGISLL